MGLILASVLPISLGTQVLKDVKYNVQGPILLGRRMDLTLAPVSLGRPGTQQRELVLPDLHALANTYQAQGTELILVPA